MKRLIALAVFFAVSVAALPAAMAESVVVVRDIAIIIIGTTKQLSLFAINRGGGRGDKND